MLYFSANLIVTGIKIATIAVLFTTAEATPIANKYAIIPNILDLSIKEFILIIKYSRIWDFCRAWLSINKHAIVITAGLENPSRLSAGLTKPKMSNRPKTNRAVTSIGNNSDFVSRNFAPKLGIPEDPVLWFWFPSALTPTYDY